MIENESNDDRILKSFGFPVWLCRKSLGMILSKWFILYEFSKLVEYNR